MAYTLHSNNAVGYLLTGLTTSSTTLILQSGQGARFPAIGPDQNFFVTIEDRALGLMEIALCTSRTVDSLTVTRAQQGTPATAFSPGTSVSNRVTAEFLNGFGGGISDAIETSEAAAVAAATALAAATQAQSQAAEALAVANSVQGIATEAMAKADQAYSTAQAAQVAAEAADTKADQANAAAGAAQASADTALSVATSAQQDASAAVVAANDALAQVDDKAPIDSPDFQGNTRVPTVGAGTNTTAAANTIFVNSAISDAIAAASGNYAPIDSPDFQGVPKVPTAVLGTNSTQAASTAYVVNAIGASTVAFAPILSPDFQGVPKVPTAAPGTATTQAASTEFVGSAIAAIPSAEATLAEVVVTGSGAKTIAVGANTRNIHIAPVGNNIEIGVVSGLIVGKSIMVFMTQDTVDRTVTLSGSNAILATPDALSMVSGAGNRAYAILTGGRKADGSVEPTFYKVTGPA